MIGIELIQIALGNRKELSHVPSEKEWEDAYAFAEKQSLIGVMFSAIDLLGKKKAESLELRDSLAESLELRDSLAESLELRDSLAESLELRDSLAESLELRDSLVESLELRDSLAESLELRDSLAESLELRGERMANAKSQEKTLSSQLNTLSSQLNTLSSLSLDLMMDWIGQTEYIKTQNEVVNKRAAEVTKLFAEGGFRSVVLKGQGVAQLYRTNANPNLNPNLRTSGDIDLWVDGDRKKVISFMKGKGWKVGRTVVHHTDVEIFPDTSVEVHRYPSFTYSPFRWRKYRKWFKKQLRVESLEVRDESLELRAESLEVRDERLGVRAESLEVRDERLEVREDFGFNVPTIGFNLVYSLLHIFRHVFHEGIGLRQMMDYYFILMHSDESSRKEAMKTIRWMGLERFAAAVMFVLAESFELRAESMLCEPDEEAGRFLLEEIMTTGNFGKYNEGTRKAHRKGAVALYLHNVGRLMKMVRYYPSEVLWAPIWKPVHFAWRKLNNY